MPQGDGKLSDIVLSRLEKIIDAADALAVERCTWMLAHRDFTPELKWVNENSHVPILCLHGDSDPAMPFEAVKQIHDIIPRSTLKKYVNGGHGKASFMFNLGDVQKAFVTSSILKS